MKKKHIAREKKIESFLRSWLVGTTCARRCKKEVCWRDKSGQFVVLNHHCHSSYVDRCEKSVACTTFQAMYDIDQVSSDNIGDRRKMLIRWEGRWNKAKVARAEKIAEKMGDIPCRRCKDAIECREKLLDVYCLEYHDWKNKYGDAPPRWEDASLDDVI